jgi:hypothetical protein
MAALIIIVIAIIIGMTLIVCVFFLSHETNDGYKKGKLV